ncbi:hypothetical protein HanRHA438_Chr11g0494051 [Helianthus annuus]|nr:hypothetical protein HanRHA438_Chr11g0494051 [Helianthus annuus]
MLEGLPSRHATAPRATRGSCFPGINRGVWQLISGVGLKFKFVSYTELFTFSFKTHTTRSSAATTG